MTRTGGTSPQRAGAIRTFLIADIRGWTKFTNELGDEAASRLASKFAQVVGEAVEAYGGTLLELRGDEAMCVFESARGALRCAVELQDAFTDETRLEPHLPLNVGIGLDAGEAVPVADGYRGAALNLAARLCSAAAAGDVIATDGLVHLVGRLEGLAYAALDGKHVKGFVEPVSAWLVSQAQQHVHKSILASHAAAAGSLPADLDAIVPLVGREADLRWLSWFWRRARHGHGGLVALAGKPGMGRTRLVAELAAAAHADGSAVRSVRDEAGFDLAAGSALVIVDDVDQLSASGLRRLLASPVASTGPHLTVLTHLDPPPPLLARALEQLVSPERRRTLLPLGIHAVARIAELYLERPDVDPPVRLLLEESEGVPAAVHRVASQWARAAAGRRLGQSARRTSRERRELRAAEAEMIEDVARLEHARERTRLFVDGIVEADGPPASTVCPYKGLAAFEAADAPYYFGRERLIAQIIARMVGSSFVALVGASGSGKSSALQAGLLPALAGGVLPGSDTWIQVRMRPHEHPMHQLQTAFSQALPQHPRRNVNARHSLDDALEAMAPSQRTLIVIDQFEELFTTVADEVERSTFIDFITEPRAGLKLLVAVRADYYERCASYPRLAHLLASGQVLVGPASADEVVAIIRHPAERVGLRVDGELVDALVADLGTEPGGLPLLSTSLLELWEARDAGRLTLSSYRAVGGVHGAVARLAESAYARLDRVQQAVARAVFLRLAGEGESGTIVRRRVRLRELDVDDNRDVASVLSDLTAARLLTTGDGYVEVAHEALFRGWPRLRAWIEDDSAGRQLRLHLAGAARTWDEGGREDGDLYRGARLASVLDWSSEHLVELNTAERHFVEASRAASVRAAERQRRTNRNLRLLLGGAAISLVAAVGASIFAVAQARQAHSHALYAAAVVEVDQDPERAILLALEAFRLGVEPPADAVTALHRAVRDARTLLNTTLPDPLTAAGYTGAALSPDGEALYVSTDSGSVTMIDVDTSQRMGILGSPRRDELASGWEHPIAVSKDGEFVAVVDEEAVVHIWRVGDQSEQTLSGPGYGAGYAQFSPDGSRIAATTWITEDRGGPSWLTVWELDSEEVILHQDFDSPVTFAYAENGESLYVTDCVCDTESTEVLVKVPIASGSPIVVRDTIDGLQDTVPQEGAVSPDGTMIVTGGADDHAVVWDVATGERRHTLVGHEDWLRYVVFSPDGTRLATTSLDGTTRVWDLAGARGAILAPTITLRGQGGTLGRPEFSSDGQRLAIGSSDLSVRVWDVSAAGGGEISGTAFGPRFTRIRDLDVQGDLVAILGRPCVGVCPGEVIVVDIQRREASWIVGDQIGAAIALDPDGGSVVSQTGVPIPEGEGTALGPVDRWLLNGQAADRFDAICDFAPDPWPRDDRTDQCENAPDMPFWEQPWAMDFTPDGLTLVMGGFSGAVSVWDGESGALRRARPAESDLETPYRVGVSSDGTLIASLRVGGGVTIHDASTLEVLASTKTHRTGSSMANVGFSPDGTLVVAAGAEFRTLIIDAGTGEIVRELPVHSTDFDFDSDGRLLTADIDGYLRLWDIATGTEQQRIPGSDEGWARYLESGHIAIADRGAILVLTPDIDELIEVASGRVNRQLTAEECHRYNVSDCGRTAHHEPPASTP